jgi:glycosyltransferase involved in cell wall biosynthesis
MTSSENNRPLSVMMIAASLPPLPVGGAETQALRLGEALIAKGVTVQFITPGKGSIGGATTIKGMPAYRLNSFANRLFGRLSGWKKKQAGTPVTRVEYDDSTETTNRINSRIGWPTIIYYNIFYYHSLFFLWRRRRTFDILHAHTMEWSAIVAARLGKALGKPVLIKDSTMNGFASLIRFPDGARMQHKIIQQSEFVAMTRIIGENMEKAGIPAAKISYIPNGLSIDPNQPRREPASPPAVLFVGNLYQQPAKGIDILLKAWVSVSREHPTAVLEIVGDGDLPAYEEYSSKLGIGNSVRFHGKRSDLPAFYRKAAVFVLPSRREGMSNALMEAMSQALPCVATDISGSQDLIRSGENGLIVPPADAAALAKALNYMLAHPSDAAEMGRKAWAGAAKQIDMEVVAKSYVSLYRRLLNFSL